MNRRSFSKKHRQIQTAIEDLVLREFLRLYGSEMSLTDNAVLDIQISLKKNKPLQVEVYPSLQEQIRNKLRDLATRSDAYHPGSVYCYLHESNDCDHCYPSSPSQVMSGYQANGIPLWSEFSDVLIDEDPEMAAFFFENRKHILSSYIPGRNLKKKLLSSFGKSSKTYSILGQLICGLFTLQPSAISSQTITDIALTIQAVEHQTSYGKTGLDINVVSILPAHQILDLLADTQYNLIRETIISARRKIKDIESQLQSKSPRQRTELRKKYMPKIPEILLEIRHEISRSFQRSRRRTLHAETRSNQQRPIFKAIEDLISSFPDWWLEDRNNKTILIPGKRKRWHVFSYDGKLVTSLYLNKEQVQNRCKRNRWQKLSFEKQNNFLGTIKKLYPDMF